MFVVTLIAVALASVDDVQDKAREAAKAYAFGDFAKAVALYREAAALAPDDIDIRYNLGVAAIGTGDGATAEQAFRAVVLKAPDHGLARFNLGKLLVQSGKASEAVAHLERAVVLLKGDREPRLELAAARLVTGELEKARDALQGVQGAEALSLLAFADLREEAWDAALAKAQAAAKLEPRAIRYTLLLAVAEIHAGMRDAALKTLKRLASDAPPSLANVPYAIGLAAFLAGEPEEARRWLREARERAPGAFDLDSPSFDPMAFPTSGDLAFLRWAQRDRGPNRAREARIRGATASGPGCHPGLVLEALLPKAAKLQACFPPRGRVAAVDVTGEAKATLSIRATKPAAEAALCVIGVLARTPTVAPRTGCQVAFRVESTR